MKRFPRHILTALTVLAALSGCRTAEQEMPDSLRNIRFRAVADAETRTAFAAPENGQYRTLWTGNERDILLSLNYAKAESAAVTASADGATASFEAAFDPSAAASPYTFYAVSPASAARAISPSRKAWSVYIAADQTPLASSVDEGAQLLVAKSAASATLPETVDLHFSHLTAYGRIELKNLDLGDAVADRVDLIFGTPVAGEWYWGEDGTLTSNGASHTITLHTGLSGDLWFACAPVDVGGKTLKLKVYTDQSVLVKDITFPEGRSFASGKVAHFTVDMAGLTPTAADVTFKRVESVSELQAGDELLIVYPEGGYALGAQETSGTPHRVRTSVTVENGRIASAGEATVLTLEAGSRSGTWALWTGSGYLSAASSKNVLQESSSKNDYSSWTITIENGVTTVKARSGDSPYIRYNPSSPRFSCYKSTTSNMKDITLFRRTAVEGGPEPVDPLAGETEYGCYLTATPRVYAKGSDQLFRTYTPDARVEFTLLNAQSREQLVVSGYDPTLSKGSTARVSVSYRRGRSEILKGTYELTVVREDGPKVWLGDGSGRGLIIKK